MHTCDETDTIGKRIAFIMYEYGLGNSPSLINAARYLAKQGYLVDFFTCGTFLGNVKFDDCRIQIHTIVDVNKPSPAGGLFSKIKQALYNRISGLSFVLPWQARLTIEENNIQKSVDCFVKSVISILETARYECFIGVEPPGLMAAYQLGLYTVVPFAYYNLELHIESDAVTPNDFIIKKIEKTFNKFASFTIVQDIERGRLLAKENGIVDHSLIVVPVCADGETFKVKTSCLRDMFGLTAETRIILYAGYIADWAMCAEIAESARSWPENWVLIFHTHGYNDENYIKKVKQFENRNVLFSLTPVPYEELSAFLASADIGIALYRDLGANFTLISSASGKLAHYLKSGLPVIVNSYPAIAKLVDHYNCGSSVNEPEQLREAIGEILDNYEQMHSGAYRCYEENYQLSRYFSKVVDRIEQL